MPPEAPSCRCTDRITNTHPKEGDEPDAANRSVQDVEGPAGQSFLAYTLSMICDAASVVERGTQRHAD